jgi:hypothetical protein
VTTIEIPVPELRIEERTDYPSWDTATVDSEADVEFRLVFGGYVIASRTYVIPMYDSDNYAMDRRRDEFRQYVAERLSGLFEEETA